jgi:tetratricopeptide (TPR) repeat protein
MTNIKLLLFRLAELMLEQEQHVLLVDNLFDDEQIGNFVKSIQIDSPYQQMIFEGVLTESVREEKLYVCFTLEGYFHYVLGEVIYNQTEVKEPKTLKKIIEENNLNGAKEGVEQCLIRDVQKADLTRLIWLIDEGGKALEISSYPLAQAFLIQPINKIMDELLYDTTENDIKVLEKAIKILKSSQLNTKLSAIYKEINNQIEPKTIKNANLYVQSIKYIPEEERTDKLDRLNQLEITADDDESGLFYSSLGYQYDFIANYDKAIDYYEKSLAICVKVHGDQHSLTGACYKSLGTVWCNKGDYDKAIDYYEKSLAINLQEHGNNHAALQELYNNLGISFGYKGGYVKSMEYYEKSLAISILIHGDQHPSTAGCYMGLGWIYRFIGDYDKSIAYYEKALLIYSQVHGDKHESTASSHNNLGSVCCYKKDFDKALFHYEKSLLIMLKVHGEEHPSTATSYVGLGTVSKSKSDFDAAINYFIKAQSIFIKFQGHQHPSTGITYFHLASVYRDKGEFDRAILHYENAHDIFLKVLGEDHNYTKMSDQKIKELNDL